MDYIKITFHELLNITDTDNLFIGFDFARREILNNWLNQHNLTMNELFDMFKNNEFHKFKPLVMVKNKNNNYLIAHSLRERIIISLLHDFTFKKNCWNEEFMKTNELMIFEYDGSLDINKSQIQSY